MENRKEEARAYSNLGSAYHSQRDFDKAVSYHTRVLELARELADRAIEMRAYAGLGHAARCMQVGDGPPFSERLFNGIFLFSNPNVDNV